MLPLSMTGLSELEMKVITYGVVICTSRIVVMATMIEQRQTLPTFPWMWFGRFVL